MKDTKELNAGIALLALQIFDEAQVLSEEAYTKTVAVAYRLEKTPLYKDYKDSDNAIHIQQAARRRLPGEAALLTASR